MCACVGNVRGEREDGVCVCEGRGGWCACVGNVRGEREDGVCVCEERGGWCACVRVWET